MLNGVTNFQEFNKFLDDMLKLSFRSRYMTQLYQAKREKNHYLTQEEEKDYLLHCSILHTTADLFAQVYDKFISTAKVSDDNKLAEMAEWHSKGAMTNLYSFGAIDPSKMVQNLANLQYNATNLFEESKKIVTQEILGMGSLDMMKKVEEFGKTFTPDEKRTLLDKTMLTYALHSTSAFNQNVTPDKEWSKQSAVKYGLGDPDEYASKMFDYRDLLAKYGIDMGELPKTFVSENVVEQNYGRSTSRR